MTTLITAQVEVRPSRNSHSILLVDDEGATRHALTAVLDGAGFEVTQATDLEGAGRQLAANRFDLVVTDLYLSADTDGLQVADVAAQQTPRVPVVLMTGRPSFGAAQNAIRTHVREIVAKPVDGDQLIETCRRTIEIVEVERRARNVQAQNRVLAMVAPRMVEAKDPTTSGHASRVVNYVDRMAERFQLDEDTREDLRLAALLHDVGKVGVPDEILRKEGPLTPKEREIIQLHPAVGRDILAELDCEDARRWVYQHHERWDGKGYPEGIGGEEVDFAGRMLILAEVYDALAEQRSYKDPWPIEKIVAFFRDQAGKHFDPELALEVAAGLESQGSRYFSARNELF
ncbi:MAG: HD domain-containing phosphohydrolase [Planctomycetota bacterium]